MTSLHPATYGLLRRIFSALPARVPLPGFILLMMGMSSDAMTLSARAPGKSVQHSAALVIAGIAVYLGDTRLVEQRTASWLTSQAMAVRRGVIVPPAWKRP